MATLEAVLFDVDDTLYDRRGAQVAVLREVMRELPDLFGPLDEDAVLAAFAASDRQTAHHAFTTDSIQASRDIRSSIFLRELGLPPDRGHEVTTQYVAAYRRTAAPVPGAARVVAACRQRYRVGVVSNAFPDVQYHKLEAIGLRHAFECVLLSEEVGIRKPEKGIFLRACQLLQLEPQCVLYVGDSFQHDVVGAHRAGMLTCWFNPRADRPPELDITPELEIGSLEELIPALESYCSA